jgi:nicotinamide-nucleotide amidase
VIGGYAGQAMKAEIIAIGSELLTPDRIDTNSLYLTQRLNEVGFEVSLKSIVGDNTDDIENLVRAALQRSRLIVLCGGLGPTEDDLTRVATARALQRRLTLHEEILEALRRRFAMRGYRMAKINERQAEVIDGAEILNNPVGTAPGMWIEEAGAFLVLLPGPPRELQAMFESQVLPRAIRLGSQKRLKQTSLSLQGLPESEVDTRIAPIYKSYPQIQTTILAAKGCISVRLQRWLAPGERAVDVEELAGRIHAELGDDVFSTADESLEEVVGRLLRQSGRSLAVAESCTAGMVASTITRVPGSSDYFRGGVICYSNELKADLCRVPHELLERHGAVSAEVAEALACGVRALAHSSIGLSVTGIAGPGGGSEQKPVGLVYIGLADETRCIHTRRIFSGDRETVRELATSLAIGRLRRFLMPTEETA